MHSHNEIIPIILSYNHPELTALAVNSVLSNSAFTLNFSPSSLILIHNGSEKKHLNFLVEKFPQIDHFIIEKNKGFSGGANAGLKYLFKKADNRAHWALFLTNDCELINWPILPKNQTPSLLAPIIWGRKANQIDSVGGTIHLAKGQARHLKSEREFYSALIEKNKNISVYIPGSAFLIHSQIFSKLHGFNETLNTYWEDIDLSLRANNIGITLGVIPSFQVKHKIGKTCHKKSYYTTYLYQRNRHWISRAYVKGLKGKFMLEIHLWGSWVALGFRLLKLQRYSDLLKLIKGIFEPASLG